MRLWEVPAVTLSNLKEFIDLAYTLNFGASAARMFISQSTLSKHISSMEDELGCPLFIRSKQSVRLTEAGKTFCEQIKPLVAQYDDAVRQLQNAQQTLTGTLRFGFITAAEFIIAAVREFQRRYPNVRLDLISDEIGDLERGVKNDVLDLSITAQFVNSQRSRDMVFYPLRTDHLAAIIPRGHPLAGRSFLTFSDILDYPLSIPSPRQFPDYRRLMLQMAEELGKEPNFVCEFTNTHAAVIMAESGAAISVLVSASYSPSDATVQIPLTDPEAVVQIGALYKVGNTTPGLQEFLQILATATAEKL